MSDYMTAYIARLKRNQEALIKLINDVREKDPSVEAYVSDNLNRHIQGVVFIKGELINSIHFHEVPYRWSGCGYREHTNSHWGGENSSMPFDADDVLSTFKPIQGVNKTHDKPFKNREEYLKWYSYLRLYSPEKSEEQTNEH